MKIAFIGHGQVGAPLADELRGKILIDCTNPVGAKEVVGRLIAELGWEPLDVGGLEQALHPPHPRA